MQLNEAFLQVEGGARARARARAGSDWLLFLVTSGSCRGQPVTARTSRSTFSLGICLQTRDLCKRDCSLESLCLFYPREFLWEEWRRRQEWKAKAWPPGSLFLFCSPRSLQLLLSLSLWKQETPTSCHCPSPSCSLSTSHLTGSYSYSAILSRSTQM